MSRFRIRDLLWLTLVIGLALGWAVSYERGREAADDRRLEFETFTRVREQLGKLKLGMDRPTADQLVHSVIPYHPRHPGSFILHSAHGNDFGRRSTIIQGPYGRHIVLEFGINYSAPLEAEYPYYPKDETGWQLERWGESDVPYLK